MQFRLQTKFLSLLLGSLILLLGLFSFIVVERESRLLAKKGLEKQHILSDVLLAHLKQSMITGRPRSTLDLMDKLQSSSGLVRLKALRRDGTPAFGVAGTRLDLPRLERVFTTGAEIDYPEQGGLPVHTILLPLKNEGECQACHQTGAPVLGAIMVSLSMADTEAELGRSKRDFAVMLSLLILLIGGALSLLIKKIIVSPLLTLHKGAETIGSGNLSHRIDLKTNDELQDLAQAFNAMTVQIEESHAGLENKISERTAQVERAMEEIQDKAGRLYSHSRDMATISRLSTKVFNAELSQEELLDRFMAGVTRGLGYRRVLLGLISRKHSWLDIRRDTGVGDSLRFLSQSLLSDDPLVKLIRSAKVAVIEHDDLLYKIYGGQEAGPTALIVIPLLNRTHTKQCRQITSCIKADCPAYHDTTTSCWLISDTLCGNPLIESFGNKLAYCMTCQVFPVIGVLIVAADEKRKRSRSISVLRILAAEMAAALENHRLHEDNQRMVRELLELHRVTAVALSDLSLAKALDVFTDSALKFSGMDTCSFWLLSPDNRELVRKAGGCVDERDIEDLCPERLPLDQGLLGRAFHQNSFVVNYNVARNDDTLLSQAAGAHGLNSLLAISLKGETGPLGVFAVNKRDSMPFLETEIAAFMLLANQAAMAINACQLHNELTNQNRELARNMNLLSGILSSMSSGVMLLDNSGTVLLVNLAGASILKTRPENLMNRRLSELFPEAAAFTRLVANPPQHQQIELRQPDGNDVPIGFSSASYNGASGDQEGIIVVYQDLSEIKALQTELLNKERFAAMGRVVAGVAHEIRNPLFGISSVGQILEREIANPAHLELLRALMSETRRMNQLIEELLHYGKPLQLHLESCNLSSLWEEVISMHREELDRRGIRISGDLDLKQLPAYLDADQVRQVFLNLLRNSIDATPKGGEISIRMLLEDRFIVFQIVDTGSGIPAKNLDRVFDLFFTTKPKGTGLGLAICKKIIQDHGGSITVESRQWDWMDEKRGTTVIVKLPYLSTAEQPGPEN